MHTYRSLVLFATTLVFLLAASQYASAAPKYEWVQIPNSTYPDIRAKNNDCHYWGGIVQDSWQCTYMTEGMVVRSYDVQQVGDRIGQGWSEAFSADRSRITYSRWENCAKAGVSDAGPGHRVYECKNVGDIEPSPSPPPDYRWTKVGGAAAFTPDMRGPYASMFLETGACCPEWQTVNISCDASLAGKMAVAEYKATAYTTLADRGSFFQGTAASVTSPTNLRLTGWNRSTVKPGSLRYLARLGVGYQPWEAYRCVAAFSGPPTWTTTLGALPSSGEAPLNDVTLSASGSGTATGSVRWQFDCDGNGSWEKDVTNASATESSSCSYVIPRTYTARVRSTRAGIIAENTATVTVDTTPIDITLSGAPSLVPYNTASTVTWSVAGATECTGTGPSAWITHVADRTGAGSFDGSFDTGPLTVPTTFGLDCSNPGANVSEGTLVDVRAAPPPEVLSVSTVPDPADYCTYGASTRITWTSTAKPQSAYRVQVASNDSFSDIIFDSGVVGHYVALEDVEPRTGWWSRSLNWLRDRFGFLTGAFAKYGAEDDPCGDCTPPGNGPTDCFRDSDCSDNSCSGGGGSICINRQCWCGISRSFCSSRCDDMGYCFDNRSADCKGGTIHIRTCRGANTGTGGGVISYCQKKSSSGGGGGGGGGGGPAAPTVSLNANPASIPYGGASTVAWSSSNATTCTRTGGIAGWPGSPAKSGSFGTSSMGVSKQFTVSCSGAGGTRAKSVTVNVAAPGPADTTTDGILAQPLEDRYNETLYVRVKVWRDTNGSGDHDAADAESAWSGTKSFTTLGQFPAPRISLNPEKPIALASTSFEDIGDCNAVSCNRTWDFGDGSELIRGNPVLHTYAEDYGDITVTLTSENLDRNSCTDTAIISVSKAIPKFREVGPQ